MHDDSLSKILFVPRSLDGAIARVGLQDRLDQLAPLTVIEGLPGTGKTTLVSSWLSAYKQSSFQWWIEGTKISSVSQLLEGMKYVLAQVEAPLKQRCFIVVDDLQIPVDTQLLDSLQVLLLQEPQLHVIICSQFFSPRSVYYRRRRMEINLITNMDLEVGREDLPDFIRAWGYSPELIRCDQLWSAFSGWLGATRIALQDGVTDETGLPEAYWNLTESLLSAIAPQAMIDAAQIIALTDMVTVDLFSLLLRFTTENDPSRDELESLLQEMQRRGLIEPVYRLGSEPAWRAVSPLVMILRNGAKVRANISEIHQLIVKYWMKSPAKKMALGTIIIHARQANAWGLLAQLWQQHGLKLFDEFPGQSVEAFGAIPDDLHYQYAQLWAVGRIVKGSSNVRVREGGVSPGMQDVLAVSELKFAPASRTPLVELVLAAEKIDDLVRQGKLKEATSFAQSRFEELARLLGRKPGREVYMGLAWFKFRWAMAENVSSNRQNAVGTFSQSLNDATLAKVDCVIAVISIRFALHNAILGNLGQEEARALLGAIRQAIKKSPGLQANFVVDLGLIEATLAADLREPELWEQHLQMIRYSSDPFIEQWPVYLLSKTQYALHFGRPGVFLETIRLAQMRHRDQSLPASRNSNVLRRAEADLLMATGAFNAANKVLNDLDKDDVEFAVSRSRLLLLCGNYDGARQMAKAAMWARENVIVRDRMELLLIDASAAWYLGEKASAVASFIQAVDLAKSIGTVLYYGSISTESLEGLT